MAICNSAPLKHSSRRSRDTTCRRGAALSPNEERELFARAASGDRLARNRLVLAHLRLVATIARRYGNRGLPFVDLLQEGYIGLMIAAGKFDPDLGNRFSTYASWWIRQSMTRALSNQSRTIRLPVHLNEMMTRLRRIRGELQSATGRNPTIEELACAMEESPAKIRAAMEAFQPVDSLDRELFGDGPDTTCALSEMIADNQAAAPEALADEGLLQERVRQLLGCLNERERQVVSLRFGIESGISCSLCEVSAVMGLSRDQVGKASCQAMRKLRGRTRREDFV
ncbi:MAG: sigma-70 family RNA polymerase sigma factor [Candidatus Melainabacteria bacterium]|nr:sigma-70 family RNA polymerase sigma factor [Candidatus Melainabacteria bacterium]